MKYFLNSKHKKRFINMIKIDNMSVSDIERASLFYIISGNDYLYDKRKYVYNYDDHSINLDFKDSDVEFSSGIHSLIKLGFNLYNGWADEDTTPFKLLANLDYDNLNLARYALMVRFKSNLLNELYK